MKKLVYVPFLFVLAVSVSHRASGQNIRAAEAKRIDAYCRSIDSFTKKRKGPELVFADTSDQTDSKEKWRKFASEKALEKFREQSETYTVAYVWRKNGRVAVTNFTLFSGSGDWAKYVYSYFRADGSLARVESELRTFYGDYIVIRRRYFDSAGRLVRKTDRYLDLQSKKPKKPDPEYIDANAGLDKGDYYMKTSKLPFARLIRKK